MFASGLSPSPLQCRNLAILHRNRRLRHSTSLISTLPAPRVAESCQQKSPLCRTLECRLTVGASIRPQRLCERPPSCLPALFYNVNILLFEQKAISFGLPEIAGCPTVSWCRTAFHRTAPVPDTQQQAQCDHRHHDAVHECRLGTERIPEETGNVTTR